MSTSVSALAAGRAFGETSAVPGKAPASLPAPRIIYYNNFASHLLCAYNHNMYYSELPYRWPDADWCALIDMLAGFGFNVFEFWLEPRLFQKLTSPAPDYDALRKQYWQHVYAIYDRLPDHVDPRPRTNTARFIEHFRNWTT